MKILMILAAFAHVLVAEAQTPATPKTTVRVNESKSGTRLAQRPRDLADAERAGVAPVIQELETSCSELSVTRSGSATFITVDEASCRP